MDFSGKSAVVTGASSGLGRAIAVALGTAGARVGLVARSRQGLEETSRLVDQPGAHVFCTDLRDEKAIDQLGNSVDEAFGAVDMLVNCAGVWHDEQTSRYHGPPLLETPVERIHEVLEVGVRAPLLLTRMLLPGMVKNGAGKILQISAEFGGPHDGVGWVPYYVANKGLDAFTAALALELREHNIQVNCIAPVFVATDAVKRFYASEVQSHAALEPVDVAELAMFLLSSGADHISGQSNRRVRGGHYRSSEQARGSSRRYGRTGSPGLSAVVERDPDFSLLPSRTQEGIGDLLVRCLTKDVRQRLRDAGDARIQIDRSLAAVSPPPGERAARSLWTWGAVAVAAILLFVLGWSSFGPSVNRPDAVVASGSPVVILMDTPAPAGVYDPVTRAGGGTNADDLNDALRALPVELHKETVSSTWDREDQILRQQPDLSVIHRSGFRHSMNLEFGFDQPNHGQETLQGLLYEIAESKLMAFLGCIGLGNPNTRFIVYSRGFSRIRADAWVAEVEGRFPTLSGRVVAVEVPVGADGASFRDAATAGMIRTLVEEVLQPEG